MSRFIEPDLVGAAREELVASIMGRFHSVVAGRAPHLVYLEASSGWGKTRVVREVYRALARYQADPGYWPSELLHREVANPEEAVAARKIITAAFDHTPGSLPEHLWWGITCGVEMGLPISRLGASLLQLQAHVPYLEAAWARRATRQQQTAKAFRGFLGSLGMETALEGATSLMEGAGGTSVYGLGFAWWLSRRMARDAADATVMARLIDEEGPIGLQSASLASECAAIINRIAEPGIPTVIAVEDAHLIDQAHAELLANLMIGDSPILIVLTAKPVGSVPNPDLERLLLAREDRVTSYSDEIREISPLAQHSNQLSPLSARDRRSLLEGIFRNMAPATAEGLVERYELPLELMLIAALPRLRASVAGERLQLDTTEIMAMPSNVRSLYRSLWEDLPVSERRAIAAAVICSPGAVAPQLDFWTIWNPELMGSAIRKSEMHDAEEVASALKLANRSWVRQEAFYASRVLDDDRALTITDDLDLLSAREITSVKRELSRLVGSILIGNLTMEEMVVLWPTAQLAIALSFDGQDVDRNTLIRAGFVIATTVVVDVNTVGQCIKACRFVLGRLGDGHPAETGDIRRLFARALLEAGQVNEAILQLRRLQEDLEREFGAESIEAKLSVPDYAAALRDSGRSREALIVVNGALPYLRASPEVDREQLWIVEHSRAVFLSEAGQLAEARDALNDLIRSMRSAGAERAPLTILVRGSLGAVSFRLGDLDALSQLRSAASDLESVFGEKNEWTLRVRNNLAVALQAHGNSTEALRILTEITATKTKVLGPVHPSTLVSRGNLAGAYHDHGQLDVAIRKLRSLQLDYLRHFGELHPDTLTCQNNLAGALLESGAADEAAALFELVVPRLAAVRGASHHLTSISRKQLLLAHEMQTEMNLPPSSIFRRPPSK